MSSPRLAHGSLHHHGAGLLPDDLEGVDYLLLDGGPVVAPDEEGPEEQLDEAIRRLAPTLYLDPRLKVVASLAGRRPEAAAQRVAAILAETGNAGLPVGVVHGSDVLDRLEEYLAAGERLKHQVSGHAFVDSTEPVLAASVSLDPDAVLAPQSGKAVVTVVGDANTSELKQRLEGKPVDRKSLRPLELVVQDGYAAYTVLRTLPFVEAHALFELEKRWLRALRRSGLPDSGAAVELLTSEKPGASRVAIVTYRHKDETVVRRCLARLQQLRQAPDPARGRPIFEIPPQFVRKCIKWPTSIPTDLVEWSVDVRPAKDWVE